MRPTVAYKVDSDKSSRTAFLLLGLALSLPLGLVTEEPGAAGLALSLFAIAAGLCSLFGE